MHNGGIILVVLGALFLLHNLGFIPFLNWDIIWPVLLIFIGFNLMSMAEHRRASKESTHNHSESASTTP